MDPAVGLLRSLPIILPRQAGGMLQGVPIVEDFTAPHKHLAPVPDPLGSIPHNHYHGGAVSNQPNSRNCAYRRAKMASASPRQLPRKRRTTVWRPGEVSTRSLGNSSTPVLTSWNGPSFTGGKGGGGSAPVRRRRCLRTCMPNMLPSTLSTTAGGASRVEAPSLRLSAWYRFIPSL